MKKINPGVKSILASGFFDATLREEMMRSGAKDFIQKPYKPDAILRRIREVIDETN
jgi:FixJ family two-component response regulator